ncbi:efflux RND transporter periplasmic adaptor subunit [Dyadobacter frigoris]|uniref:Efflux RND transporter periplasmic adaptor subunit n=1 Tax=Dyadobacter frigoris TaxID=2576211 RepID=A0A4U6CYP2_9BACT|nr:efflux RND transporter periplasmic adaptor subunit [Dyadobacter frigoris]TKT88891.1 efflux RND transporter periplasmic adaptor subunit [Dyadobacter frigoris]GLU56085.1 hemolysin D [Dyadobacter frigoris]
MKTIFKINPVILLFAAALLVTACKEKTKTEKTDSTIPVKIINSASLNQVQAVETSGLLSSENEARLSFKVGGIIRQILVKEGDHVRKGQLLATLNTTEISAQMSLAEENYLKAKRDAQRTQNLYRDSVNTKEQLQNSQTNLAITEKQMEISRFNLSHASIVAPADGVVIKKLVNAGEQIEGGAPVLFISGVHNDDWIIKCGLTDKDWTRLKGNEKAEISFDAFSQTFTGSVKTLAQGSDVASGLFQAEIRVDKQNVKLVNGLFAKVSIYPKEKTDMISIPFDALIEGENDSAFVFVANGNVATKKAVKVAYLEGSKAFILSGIGAGEKIIREGSAYLANGSVIKIVQ